MNCDSLVEENMNLIGLVTEYEDYTDSVERMHADNDRLRDSIDKVNKTAIDSLRSAYNKVASDKINLLLNQPVKKEKRFSGGPAIGGGFGNNFKPTSFVGFTITYSLFKF
jgi:hypothetical protein